MSYPVQPFAIGDTVRAAQWYAQTLPADRANETGTVSAVGVRDNSATVTVDWRNSGHGCEYRVNFIDHVYVRAVRAE